MTRRWLIRCLFMVPILVCVVGWGWSYPFREHIAYQGAVCQEWAAEIGGGGIFLGRDWGSLEPRGWHYYHVGPDPFANEIDVYGTGLLGFRYFTSAPPPAGMGSFVIVPFWLVTMVCALILIGVWLKTRPRRPGGAFPVEVAAKEGKA